MRQAGLSTATVNNTLSIMANVFAFGVKANLLAANPAKGIRRETPGDPRDLPVSSPAQIATLLDAIQASRFRMALLLGVGLGLRSGEARGLRWRDVDFERRIIHIRNSAVRWRGECDRSGELFTPLKSKSSRRDLPMPDFIYEALRAERRAQAERRLQLGPRWTDLDLVCTRHGALLQPDTLADEMIRLREVTGIEGLVYHHLRHLCATVMMLNNVPPRIAQGVLGHATPTTTMRIYQHVTSDALREAADALNAAFAPGLRDDRTG
jgi:integrase